MTAASRILAATLALGVTVCAQAGSVQVLPYGDHAFKPKDVLQLKRKLKSVVPDYDFANRALVSVHVLAKSREGRGRIRLQVGNRHGPWQNVGGSVEGWEGTGGATFREVVLENPAAGSEGYWRIEVDGYLKVREIRLEIREDPGKTI